MCSARGLCRPGPGFSVEGLAVPCLWPSSLSDFYRPYKLINIMGFFYSLAETLVGLFKGRSDFADFMMAVGQELGELDFPEEFIFDLWGVMGDAKDGRIWNASQWLVHGSFHQVGARFVTVSIVTSVNVPSIILDYKCTFTVLQIRMKSISPPSIGNYNNVN